MAKRLPVTQDPGKLLRDFWGAGLRGSPVAGTCGTTCAGTWNGLCPRLPEPTAPATDDGADNPIDLSVQQWPDTTRIAHTRQRHQRTHDLRDQGLSMRAIARRLDLNFRTARRYLRAAGQRRAGQRAGLVQALPVRAARPG